MRLRMAELAIGWLWSAAAGRERLVHRRRERAHLAGIYARLPFGAGFLRVVNGTHGEKAAAEAVFQCRQAEGGGLTS